MRKQYEKEFKLMIVGLLESGQSVKQISQDYQLNDSMVHRWKREYHSEKEAFTGNGRASLTPQEKEVQRLKKELKEVQLERDILKKAVGIFSKSDRTSTNS